MLLQNKHAVIHGAGGAIGGAVARAFAREGAKVFLPTHRAGPRSQPAHGPARARRLRPPTGVPIGARARSAAPPLAGFTTNLLLPAALPLG
jgi:NAD(P)-dependent dehydrogenase (short-subunit alcohol dehydrogenase family)